ncbi:hypothetical protein [Terriglobus tenax]|uniref:hypothetical protein n=1 Tax=Terriglobus tenax TaxID=1111115 RepID=UPI0021DF5403|nr:hypothetical protein [Terriglobus tenax]
MNAHARIALLLGVAMAAAGCNSPSSAKPENFQAGLNKYWPEHRRDCLFPAGWRFPYTTSDPAEQAKLDAMVKVLLLKRTKEQKLAYYEPTDYGKSGAPRYCYGYREATEILSNTPLAVKDGFRQTTVNYRYEMKDVPTWAKSEDLKTAFPQLAKDLSGQATDTTPLAQTNVGWQVPE